MHHSENSLLGSSLGFRCNSLESHLNTEIAQWFAFAILNILFILMVVSGHWRLQPSISL